MQNESSIHRTLTAGSFIPDYRDATFRTIQPGPANYPLGLPPVLVARSSASFGNRGNKIMSPYLHPALPS
jgi:hypothetical protein